MPFDKDEWVKFYEDFGINPEFADTYVEYAESIAENGVPPIFDLNHLALLTGIRKNILHSMIFSTNSFYRTFEIKKKRGGMRSISSPYPSLLQIQRWIYQNILRTIPISKYCHGFVDKRSIISHARIHKSSEKLVKLDIKDFFPSIEIERIYPVFKNLNYSHKVSWFLARICCLDEKLPQGAPTSPILSNIILRPADNRIFGYCKKRKIKFTRYADDICLSGTSVDHNCLAVVRRIIRESGFEINEKKTQILSSGQKKIVTGIDISSGQLKPTKAYRRKLKQDVYYINKYGIDSVALRQKENPHLLMDSLRGRLSFWGQVSPKSEEYLKVKAMFDEETHSAEGETK